MTTFQTLNLNPKILTALENKGYTNPTPIQLKAIPHLLEGKDFLGVAQTGTGKTAAFALPILHNLAKNKVSTQTNAVRALILTPTRELASQIAENIETYGKDLNLKHTVIFGGVSEYHQIKALARGMDIVIATPGRLLDLMNQGYIRFNQLETFVLDEADRMLDMGFINDIKKIISKLPMKKQTLFFSATMPETITSLAFSILKDPIKVEITPQATTVERIKQKINFVAKSNKILLLKNILKEDDTAATIVFSRTKHGANKILENLEKYRIPVAAIHGNKSQASREKALRDFRAGQVKVLVATDIAARGIDVPNVSHVINYDIPHDPESYVHRIGRTARAGREGIAISFCDPSEHKFLQAIEKTIRVKIPVDESHAYHNVEGRPVSEGFRSERRPTGNRISHGNRRNDSRRDGSDRRVNAHSSEEGQSKKRPTHKRNFKENILDLGSKIVKKFTFSSTKKPTGEGRTHEGRTTTSRDRDERRFSRNGNSSRPKKTSGNNRSFGKRPSSNGGRTYRP